MGRAGLAAAIWTACSSPSGAQILSVTLQKPARDFGIFVGDPLTATATIRLGPDTLLDRDSLPVPGPAGASIDVRRVAVSQDRDGSLVTILVTYQSFVAPPQVIEAEVPGYTAAFTRSGVRLAARVPGFTFTASPFRHDLQAAADPALLRPDHPALAARDAAARWLAVAGGTLALLAGLTLLAERGWRGRGGRGPFAEADRQIASARRRGEAAGALLALHRAFDATAGRRVLAADIGDFLAQQQHFAPSRHDVETFFSWSRKAFFDAAGGAPPWPEMVRMARALRRAERS